MAVRVGLLILVAWTAVAIPVALLIGRVLASADRTVADEAAPVLRRRRRPASFLPRPQRAGAMAAMVVVVLVTGILDSPARVPLERTSTRAAQRTMTAPGSAREERQRTPRLPPLRVPAVPPVPTPSDGVDVAATAGMLRTFPPALAPWLSRAVGMLCHGATAATPLASTCAPVAPTSTSPLTEGTVTSPSGSR